MFSELSNAKLIEKIKDDPTGNSPISEINKRLDNGEFNDTDLIKLFDVLVTIKNGGD